MRLLRRRAAPSRQEGPLAEILEAEKATAATIATATLEAGAWLEAERLAIANSRDAELQALAARAAADEEAARQAARARAAAVVAAAEQFSRELRAHSDGELLPIVARHLTSIIPGPPP